VRVITMPACCSRPDETCQGRSAWFKAAAASVAAAAVQVVHCLALAADMSGDSAGAIKWLEVLTSLVPHDPGVLCKLGAIYHRWGGLLAVAKHSMRPFLASASSTSR
jgi:hypothetical protein